MKKVGITLSAGWWKVYEVSKTYLRDLELKISLEVSGLGDCGSKSPIIRVLENYSLLHSLVSLLKYGMSSSCDHAL